MSMTLERILRSAPDYYSGSAVYTGIQAAKAAEWDRVTDQLRDLALQMHPTTATWALTYYEEAYNLETIETDSYEIRRSRIMAKLRSPGNFSAKLIQQVCESFSNGQVSVSIDFDAGQVTIAFTGLDGIPPNLDDLKAAVDKIVHCHLGVAYVITNLTWDVLDAGNVTWDTLDSYTWDTFEKSAF